MYKSFLQVTNSTDALWSTTKAKIQAARDFASFK